MEAALNHVSTPFTTARDTQALAVEDQGKMQTLLLWSQLPAEANIYAIRSPKTPGARVYLKDTLKTHLTPVAFLLASTQQMLQYRPATAVDNPTSLMKLNPIHIPTRPHCPQMSSPDVLSWELSLVVVGQFRHLVAEPVVHAVDPLVVPQPCSGLAADTPTANI